MPQIAMATSAAERIADSVDEASTTRVDDLIQRGRSQGHLSLAELRTAFDQAGLTPRPSLDRQGPRGVPRAVRRAPRPREPPSRLSRRPSPGLIRRTMTTWPTQRL